MELYDFQKEILKKDPHKTLLALSTGLGKSIVALSLAKGNTLVVCPKTLRDDTTWERNLKKIDNHKITNLTVISKEDFKKQISSLKRYDTVIIDEAHFFSGILPIIKYRKKIPSPKTSQLFEDLYSYLNKYQPERLYLLTATPIRSPMSVLALAWLLNFKWDFYKFRDRFYFRLNIPHREIWTPKKDKESMSKLAELVNKIGITGKMEDYVEVPEQTFIIKNVGLTTDQNKRLKTISLDYPEPIVLLGKKHQIENGILTGDEFNKAEFIKDNKLEVIEELTYEYSKILIFAKYKLQIQKIKEYFEKKGIKIFTLTGDTKDRGTLMKEAETSEKCIVISQSNISAGYELPSFRCTIYASQDFSHVNDIQSRGRTLRINALNKNLYVYLLSGEIDKAVNKSLEIKEDFSLAIYANKR